ncbi:MAG: integrase zinc binding domain-containing protein [Tannerellaceae bacterium]
MHSYLLAKTAKRLQVVAEAVPDAEVNSAVAIVVNSLPVTAEIIADATEQDKTIKEVMRYLQKEWPSSIKVSELQQYYQRRDALSVVQNCLMFVHRVVILNELRSQVLQQFHIGHPGISRMKAIERSYVYWPLFDAQIEDMIHSCSACVTTLKHPPRAEPQSLSRPLEQ